MIAPSVVTALAALSLLTPSVDGSWIWRRSLVDQQLQSKAETSASEGQILKRETVYNSTYNLALAVCALNPQNPQADCITTLSAYVTNSESAYCNKKLATLQFCQASYPTTNATQCAGAQSDFDGCDQYVLNAYSYCITYGFETADFLSQCANIELTVNIAPPTSSLTIPAGSPLPASVTATNVSSVAVAIALVPTPTVTAAVAVTTDGTCGGSAGLTCAYQSIFGTCCSQYGYCGTGPTYCGDGCQALFGDCLRTGNTSSTSSALPTSYAIGAVPSASTSASATSGPTGAVSSIPTVVSSPISSAPTTTHMPVSAIPAPNPSAASQVQSLYNGYIQSSVSNAPASTGVVRACARKMRVRKLS